MQDNIEITTADGTTTEVTTKKSGGAGLLIGTTLMVIGASAGFFILGKRRGVKAGRAEGVPRGEMDSLKSKLDELAERMNVHSEPAQ